MVLIGFIGLTLVMLAVIWLNVACILKSNIFVENLINQLTCKFEAQITSLNDQIRNSNLSYINASCKYDHLVAKSFIQIIADNNRIGQIRSERDYLNALSIDLKNNGIKEPLEIIYDENGFMKLQEGHHRFLAFDVPLYPVKLIKVTKANGRFNVKNVKDLFLVLDQHYDS